jgi:hypothetical protein
MRGWEKSPPDWRQVGGWIAECSKEAANKFEKAINQKLATDCEGLKGLKGQNDMDRHPQIWEMERDSMNDCVT